MTDYRFEKLKKKKKLWKGQMLLELIWFILRLSVNSLN